jgi:hypothetical protein
LAKIPAVFGVLAFAAALEGLMAIASEKHRQWRSMTMRRLRLTPTVQVETPSSLRFVPSPDGMRILVNPN